MGGGVSVTCPTWKTTGTKTKRKRAAYSQASGTRRSPPTPAGGARAARDGSGPTRPRCRVPPRRPGHTAAPGRAPCSTTRRGTRGCPAPTPPASSTPRRTSALCCLRLGTGGVRGVGGPSADPQVAQRPHCRRHGRAASRRPCSRLTASSRLENHVLFQNKFNFLKIDVLRSSSTVSSPNNRANGPGGGHVTGGHETAGNHPTGP